MRLRPQQGISAFMIMAAAASVAVSQTPSSDRGDRQDIRSRVSPGAAVRPAGPVAAGVAQTTWTDPGEPTGPRERRGGATDEYESTPGAVQNPAPREHFKAVEPFPQATPLSVQPDVQMGAAGEMIGFSRSDASGSQTITLVDTRKSWMAVYHIDRSGKIRLVSSRPIDADFTLQLNATSPLPDAIRRMGKR